MAAQFDSLSASVGNSSHVVWGQDALIVQNEIASQRLKLLIEFLCMHKNLLSEFI